MHGVGRVGAILSAFVGAEMLSLGWSFSLIFVLLAIPALLTTLMLVMKNRFGFKPITNP
jgi:AAHS family 4-hydroxybenzoate transporter-like MFS transporter